ncbi:MAG: hypothetical protein PUA74_07875 [Clostridiales bacterium]|nr:hypothetical protein [Clostridiales bacterium]
MMSYGSAAVRKYAASKISGQRRFAAARRQQTKARAFGSLPKVFDRLFQKAARSRARSPRRRPQAAKSPYGAFVLPSFFFAPASSKKKRVEFYAPLQSLYLLSTTSGLRRFAAARFSL